jgi:hypothetical protein
MSFLTDPNYYFFLLKIFISFLLGGIVIAACIQKVLSKNERLGKNPMISLVIGIGLSPYTIALLLNYLLWLIGGKSDLFYFLSIITVFVLLALWAKDALAGLLLELKSRVASINKFFLLVGGIGIALFLVGWSFYINIKELTEHDTLEYAVQGKIFYETKSLAYNAHNYDQASGFYYVGLHGYTFPLLASWERILNSIFGIQSDLFFRSINSLYGILILLSGFLLALRISSSRLAWIFIIALTFTYGFYETIFKYHIDLYRIFFLNWSLLGLILLIRKPTFQMVLILGLLMGAQANAHSLGALLYILQMGVVFLFLPLNIPLRLKYTASLLLVSLLFGSLHYILDVIWGTGWIFQEIKFY